MSYVKENLRYLMKLKGWSIPDISRKSGVPETTVKSILYGLSKNQRLNTLDKLVKVLDCSIATLVGENLQETQQYQRQQVTSKLDEWNVDLLKEVIGMVETLCQKNEYSFGKTHMMRVIDDLYTYVLQKQKRGQGINDIEEDFIIWSLNK